MATKKLNRMQSFKDEEPSKFVSKKTSKEEKVLLSFHKPEVILKSQNDD